jgi:mycothiol system anti-sigma-R factor
MNWPPDKPTCREAYDKLETYVDRELNEVEMAAVMQHLDTCPPCQRFFHVHEGVKKLVHRNACPEKAPGYLIDRIKKSLFQ